MSSPAPVGVGAQLDPQPIGNPQHILKDAAAVQHEHDFVSAVQRSTQVEQLDAQPAGSSDGIMSTLTHKLDGISAGLRSDPATDADAARREVLFNGDPASAPMPDTAKLQSEDALPKAIDLAIDSYRQSVVFSVEAEVASTSSTSSTKTFNDLMKGN